MSKLDLFSLSNFSKNPFNGQFGYFELRNYIKWYNLCVIKRRAIFKEHPYGCFCNQASSEKWSNLGHLSKVSSKFFWSFLYTHFSYLLYLKNYKLRPLRRDRRSLHFLLLFSIYTILGPISNFSKIGLGQLYKKNKFLKNLSGTTL